MRPASDAEAAPTIPLDPSLASLYGRLEALSQEPDFQEQRALALGLALRPYAEYARALPIAPLPEEVVQAELYLFADYFPTGGQLSLIEQVRDLIEVHVPDEERAWLDPLRHSYLDLLEIRAIDDASQVLALRSLGDTTDYRVAAGTFCRAVRVGQVLVTRLIRLADRAVLPGHAILLSGMIGRAVLDAVNDLRRDMEARAGLFALGDWPEFAKQHGYYLLWQVAQARLGALVQADEQVRYRTREGQPFLYAVALYEHRAPRSTAVAIEQLDGFSAETPGASWIIRTPSDDMARRNGEEPIVARLTLTPSQLVVEADSGERLDTIKHALASTLGFSVHFRGDTAAVPAHEIPTVDLLMETIPDKTVVVPIEDERRLLGAFLDSVYLEWADRPCPALGDRTPRHAAADQAGREAVAGVIDRMERDDLGLRRTGRKAYDYNRLRAHVGLPEVTS